MSVGPLAAWELLRLGRSGALPKARVALALTMLVALALAYRSAVRGEESIAQASRVAENYLIAYLAVQILAVVVLTPAVAAGAISDEKERGRLDFLRSSMLSPAEIILGKYLGRVLHLLGILATGLPILALATLFGGVDLELLAAGTLVTATSVCALAAYSVSLAVKRSTLREVLLAAYLTLTATTAVGLCCGWIPGVSALSPIAALVYVVSLREPASLAWVYVGATVLAHYCVACYYYFAAVRDLAALSSDAPGTPPVPTPYAAVERHFVPMILDHDDPFAWRERHFAPRYADGLGSASEGCLALAATVAVFPVALLVFTVVFQAVSRANGQFVADLGTPMRELSQFVTASVTSLLMALLAVRAASSVAAERERDTLTPLLMLPVERRDILWAKWFAPLRWSRYVLLAVAVVEGCVAFSGGVTFLAALAVVAQFVAALLLANTLGLWLSVTCRTATRAVAWTLLTLLTLGVAPLIGGFPALSPPAGVWLAHESPAVAPVALQLLAAGALGWSAARRFERYGK